MIKSFLLDRIKLTDKIVLMKRLLKEKALPLFIFMICTIFLLAGCERASRITAEGLESRIKELLELPTVQYIYRDIVYLSEEERFLIFTTVDKRLLFSVNVVVVAGLDLKEGINVIPLQRGRARVELPPARILSVDADEGSIEQYFVKERGRAISRLEYYDEINRKKEDIRRDAIERNILFKAEENAKKLVRNFLHLAGFDEVEFARIKMTGEGG
ncbi:MAG: DUF4230 domain-containing protein [Spirochaetes bacterium]|nr:MAG: DUF4230 domain-containing protein [Spirochaetota bacterium]